MTQIDKQRKLAEQRAQHPTAGAAPQPGHQPAAAEAQKHQEAKHGTGRDRLEPAKAANKFAPQAHQAEEDQRKRLGVHTHPQVPSVSSVELQRQENQIDARKKV